MASKSKIAKALPQAEVFHAARAPLQDLCGRPRAVYRKFGICRIRFRKLADKGLIPGVEKGELVKRDTLRQTHDDRSHRRHVDPHPQRGAR